MSSEYDDGVTSLTIAERELMERVGWFIKLRWYASFYVIIGTLFASYVLELNLPVVRLSIIGLSILVYNLLFFFYFKKLSKRPERNFVAFSRFTNLQVSVDWIIIVLIMHNSGGIQSPVLFYFVFHIIIVSILLTRRNCYLQATFAIILVALTTFLEYYKVISPVKLKFMSDLDILSLNCYLFFFASTMYIVVFVATSIGGALKSRDRQLQQEIIEHKKAEEELESSREQLRNLSSHLQSIREEERKYIAREIHDELGQTLTVLKMDLSRLSKRLPNEQKSLLEKTKSMSKLIDTSIQTVRRISSELRPGILDDFGIAAAIEWQAEEFQNRMGIKCEVTLNPEDIILDEEYSTAIFRILQETMTNVVRHANATSVKVSLEEKANKLVLKVIDNGKGITEKQISDSKSFGLIGIRERVHSLKGEVEISSIPDKGTTVTVWIPISKKEKLNAKNTHR